MKIKPLHQNVLVEIILEEVVFNQTQKIILDSKQQAKQLFLYAKVVAVSDQLTEHLKVNQLVCIREYAGIEIDLQGTKHKILSYEDIIALIN